MKRKMGIGTLALIIGIIALLLSINFNNNDICYGDKFVEFFGLKSWSNGTSGTHYTLFYLIPLYALSIFLGYKFSDNWGAKIGRRISIFIIFVVLISIPFMNITILSYKNNTIHETENIISERELNSVNDKIIEYFSSDNAEYDNLSFNYVDIENNVVVVGLLDNSIEQQEKFKKLVNDSELIRFIQGERGVDD